MQMNEVKQLVQQRLVSSQYFDAFRSELEDCLKQGWYIVPGTIVITLPFHQNEETGRYVAVVEK